MLAGLRHRATQRLRHRTAHGLRHRATRRPCRRAAHGLCRRAVQRLRRASGPDPEAGFTLLETLVSIAVVGIVMTSLTTFFVSTMAVSNQQDGLQAAMRLATDGVDRARALQGSALTAGRDAVSTDAQWHDPVPGVAPYLATMSPTWDQHAAGGSAATAPLPIDPDWRHRTGGPLHTQHWYVGRCWWQPVSGTCDQQTATVRMYRVVVAVTWPERSCAASLCSYVTSTLISGSRGEPVFRANETARPPTVENPGNQTGQVAVPVELQVTASGGAPPLTWSASGLPTGLTMDSAGMVTGSPTASGTWSVTVRATDGFDLDGTAAFTWTVNPAPAVVNPGAQSSQGGVATSLTLAATGGTGPMTWEVTAPGPWGATGLPPGLSLDPATGVISGTPTAVGPAQPVTVTVTDAHDKTASTTFTWEVPPLTVQTPAARTNQAGTAIAAFSVTASGGIRTYTWSWSTAERPPGLTLNSGTGRISGTPTTPGTYQVRVTVTDAAGTVVRTSYFTWRIQ